MAVPTATLRAGGGRSTGSCGADGAAAWSAV